jgi:Adenylate and Guanylate cyclase catalytic domain
VRAGSREQRKTVTVLFCDLTGSTAPGQRLDPERLRVLLASYFERMKAIVERHGGSAEKFMGDAVMAVFGVPVLHEDDALRALRAAAEMRDPLPGTMVRLSMSIHRGRRRPREPLVAELGVLQPRLHRLAAILALDAVEILARRLRQRGRGRVDCLFAPAERLRRPPLVRRVDGAVDLDRMDLHSSR